MGLTLISKSDIHMPLERDACRHFVICLNNLMKHFGHWDGQKETRETALHSFFEAIVPSQEHRNTLFRTLFMFDDEAQAQSVSVKLEDVVAAKSICDLYFLKTFKEFRPAA
jgi:hypothetical protein